MANVPTRQQILDKIDEIRDYSGRKQVFTIAEVNPKNKEKD